tara:strand:+ start:15 stop:974 length:960 start_codon:yes stop_codon:yes gene_type:complete
MIMEEFSISKYQKAPYLELDNYKAPEGIKSYFVNMDDGIKIRVCHWLQQKEKSIGTILLQQGHNEFIEKYYETIQEFIDRGYSVICFDWRGQGMSERMIDDINKSFINDFERHDKDLEKILVEIIDPFFSKPLIGIGHSMGGCLMLSAFKNHPDKFSHGILSAPMLGFKNEKFLRAASSIMRVFMKDTDYLIGSKPNMGIETPFEENDLTTDRFRYKRTQKLVRKKPDIRLWGVTNAFAKSVSNRFKTIRKKNWVEDIKTKILIINSINDKVVDSNKTLEINKRLKNSKIVNFQNCEHEIFIENDINRKILWEAIDSFL